MKFRILPVLTCCLALPVLLLFLIPQVSKPPILQSRPTPQCPARPTLPRTVPPPRSSPKAETAHPLSARPLIDLKTFSFLLLPSSCPPAPGLLVLVHSAVPHARQRSLIRSAWGKQVPELDTRVVFLLGQGEEGSQAEVEKEFLLEGDIVQGDFVDSYHNLTYKNVMGLLWVTEYCSGAKLIAKTDDDMWLDLHAIATVANNLPLPADGEMLACTVLHDMPVERSGKWSVSKEEMVDSNYPPACSGWLYLISNVSAATLLKAATGAKYFWIDDVWVTGILRQSIGLDLTNIPLTITTSSSHLQMSKAIQSQRSWHWDFLGGPAPSGKAANEQLTEGARLCFLGKCLNNVYRPELQPTEREAAEEAVLLKLAKLEPVVQRLMEIYG